MEIIHKEDKCRFEVTLDGVTAHVAYRIENGGLDIRHTIVPEAIGGRGVATALVKAAYDYALSEGLTPVATCAYAVVWLQRHPECKGCSSAEYAQGNSCAL